MKAPKAPKAPKLPAVPVNVRTAKKSAAPTLSRSRPASDKAQRARILAAFMEGFAPVPSSAEIAAKAKKLTPTPAAAKKTAKTNATVERVKEIVADVQAARKTAHSKSIQRRIALQAPELYPLKSPKERAAAKKAAHRKVLRRAEQKAAKLAAPVFPANWPTYEEIQNLAVSFVAKKLQEGQSVLASRAPAPANWPKLSDIQALAVRFSANKLLQKSP